MKPLAEPDCPFGFASVLADSRSRAYRTDEGGSRSKTPKAAVHQNEISLPRMLQESCRMYYRYILFFHS